MKKARCLAWALPWLLACGVAQAGSFDDFFIAVQRDNGSSIQALLQRGFDGNTTDAQGRSGLYLALRGENYKAANALLAWPQIKAETRSAQDESPLMLAALQGQLALCTQLIAKGADVNKTGWTPLHYAATHGHLDVLRLLLEHHAYIDAASPNGSTPLMMAAQYGSDDAVRLLLDEGADPMLKNQLGLGAVEFAQKASRPATVEMLTAAVRARKPQGTW